MKKLNSEEEVKATLSAAHYDLYLRTILKSIRKDMPNMEIGQLYCKTYVLVLDELQRNKAISIHYHVTIYNHIPEGSHLTEEDFTAKVYAPTYAETPEEVSTLIKELETLLKSHNIKVHYEQTPILN